MLTGDALVTISHLFPSMKCWRRIKSRRSVVRHTTTFKGKL